MCFFGELFFLYLLEFSFAFLVDESTNSFVNDQYKSTNSLTTNMDESTNIDLDESTYSYINDLDKSTNRFIIDLDESTNSSNKDRTTKKCSTTPKTDLPK